LRTHAQVVVVSQVLACDATIGYEDWSNVQVHSFNGVPVRNLRHLAEMVLECKEPYMRFDVDYDVSHPAALALFCPACRLVLTNP
jgi:hypothetical protein